MKAFQVDAPRGWDQLARLHSQARGSGKLVVDGQGERQFEFAIGTGGTRFTATPWSLMESPRLKGSRQIALAANSDYVFTILQRESDSVWLIEQIGRGTDAQSKLREMVELEYRRFVSQLWCIAGTPLGQLTGHPGFALVTLRRSQINDVPTIEMTFEFTPSAEDLKKQDKQRPVHMLRGGTIDFDPARNWAIRRAHLNVQFHETAIDHQMHFRFGEPSGDRLPLKSVEEIDTIHGHVTRQQVEFEKYEFGDPPSTLFRTTDFGVPEPDAESLSPRSGSSLLIANGIGLIAFVGLFLWYSKTRTRRLTGNGAAT